MRSQGSAGRKQLPPAEVEKYKQPSRVGKRAVNFYLDQEVWEALKLEGVRQCFRPIQSIMEELVAGYLAARRKEHGAPRR